MQNQISKNWRKVKLGELIKLEYGKGLPSSQRISGSIPVYGSNGIVGYHNAGYVKRGVVVGRKGSIGQTELVDSEFWPIDTTYYITENPKYDLRWIYYLLQTLRLKNLNRATGVPGLNRDDVYNITTFLPELKVQQKMAEILSSIDEAIQKTDQIIQKTEVLKQGLMQQVLALGKSKTSTLKEVLDFIIDHRGLTPKKLGGDWSATGMPALSAMNVKNGKIVNHDQIRFVDDALYKKWMPNELRKDDILLTSEAPLGEAYIIKDNERYCLSQRLFALRPNPSIIRSDYLYYFLISGFGRKALMDRSSGTTAKGIRQAELVKIKIHLPSLSEQEKIGVLFSSLDQKIDFEKNRKTKLILTKQGLMQDIFNQKVQIN